MKIQVIIFLLFCSFKLCAQVDSMAVAYDLMQKSDSLVEIGQYELANDYLQLSVFSRAFDISKHPEINDFLILYNQKKMALNSLVFHHVTDSARIAYRLKKAEDAQLNTDNYGATLGAHYFYEALKYNKEGYIKRDDLRQFIEKLPLDTVIIGGAETNMFIMIDSFDLLNPKLLNLPWRSWYYGDEQFKSTIVLNRIDSLPFNGVLMRNLDPLEIYDDGWQHIQIEYIRGNQFINYENGLPVDDIKIYYRAAMDSTQTEFEKNDPISNWVWKSTKTRYFLYAIETNWGEKYIQRDRNGNIHLESTKKDGGIESKMYDSLGNVLNHSYQKSEVYFNFRYNSVGDTLLYEETNGEWFKKYELFKNGLHHYVFITGYNTHDARQSIDYTLNERGDTITIESRINYRREGLVISYGQSFNGQHQLIATNWKNDSLIAYLNEDILFLNEKAIKINQNEFFNLLEDEDYDNFPTALITLLDEPLTIDGKIYNWIAYPEKHISYSDKWPKILTKASKQ